MATTPTHRQADSNARPMTERELLARLEAVLASTLDPIITIDAHGEIVSASKSIERVFGYTPGELVGQNVNVLIPSPHRAAHDGYLASYRRTQETNILGSTRELEAVRRDGSVFPMEISVSRVDVPGEEMPLFTGIIHDISERHRAEAELRLLQELSLAVGEATDLNSALLKTLRRICEVTGWEYGEAWVPSSNGETIVDAPVWYSSRENLDGFQKMTQGMEFARGVGLPGRVWQAGRSEWIEDLTDERVFRRARAAQEVGFRSGVSLPILSENEVVAVVAFYMGASQMADMRRLDLVSAAIAPLGPAIQRKKMLDALAESERRFRDMLERVELVSVILDADGRVTYCNDYFLRLAKWERDEVIGRNWFETCLPQEERARTSAVFSVAMKTGRVAPQFENEVITRHGERRLISWKNSIIFDAQGRSVGVAGMGADVTEQRRIERELKEYRVNLEGLVRERTAELLKSHEQLRQADRLASIGTLAAGLGHDMNNVLLPMRCRLDAVDSVELPESAREELAIVRRLCDYLQKLSDGLHLLALDPEDSEASQPTTELGSWWEQVSVLFQKTLPKHARFETEVEPDLPEMAVEPHRLTQAVLNLIVNAGEAIGANGTVVFWAKRGPTGLTVQLGVTDNGCGMSPEVQQRAFDPFFTTKPRGLGTGMGLSLVRGVAQSTGGRVMVESEPGRGSTLGLEVPIARKVQWETGVGRVARLSLEDARLEALVATMLRAEGFEVESTPAGEPGNSALWIVDPVEANLHEAKRYLRERAERQIVVCGPAGTAWERLDLYHIEQADDFEQMRRILRDAIDAYEGARSHDDQDS